MTRLFIGNFDFESKLTRPGGGNSAADGRRNAELSFAWLAIARPGDAIQLGSAAPAAMREMQVLDQERVRITGPDRSKDREVIAWGWESGLLRTLERQRLNCAAPPLDVVRLGNSRRYSFDLEQTWKCGLPGQCRCESVRAARQAANALDRWVIKAAFGGAGRGQIRGCAGQMTAAHEHWVARRVARDGEIFVEPWAHALGEAGLQWEIPADPESTPQLLGVTPLLVDSRGGYRGSVFSTPDDLHSVWSSAIEAGRRVADDLQRRGYSGPLGIDAMQYRDEQGAVRMRPLQDINARWTMGRLSLGWRSGVAAGAIGIQHLGRAAIDGHASQIRSISPAELDFKPIRHSIRLEIRPAAGGAKDS